MRIFWGFNDQWLVKNEIPMLVKLGHSVYIPKIPQIKVQSCVTYDYDSDLMIEKDELDALNRCNFYEHICGKDILNICSKYFDMAVIDYSRCMLENFLLFYKGIIVLRPTACRKINYTQLIYNDIGFWALRYIATKRERFFFARLDKNRIDAADAICRDFRIDLPCISMGEKKICSNKKGILYICNGIKTYPKAYDEYLLVKKEFKGLDITVIGKQITAQTNEEDILNIDTNADYSEIVGKYRCLLYVSAEEEEFPFYLFDALRMGVPIVFLAEGILDEILGTQIGSRCKTIRDAVKLCKKLLNGNDAIRKNILDEQDQAYVNFLKIQNKNFESLQKYMRYWEQNKGTVREKVKRIGIIMPNAYTGGVLDYTERLIYALKKGSEICKENIEIVFGYVKHPSYEKRDYFKKIRELGVAVREYIWEIVSVQRVRTSYLYQGYDLYLKDAEYMALNDGMSYFEDCDVLLFAADRINAELYSNVPYGMILHDYIQRYVPEILGESFELALPFLKSARGALGCFTTTEDIRQEAMMFAGVEGSRIHLLPLFFGAVDNLYDKKGCMDKDCQDEDQYDYFVWSTNTARHKNHHFALEVLLQYFENGGSLKCVMTGANTDKFDIENEVLEKDSYIEEIRDIFKSNPILQESIIIKGNLPKQRYFKVLSGAKFFLNTSCNDNGNGTAFDAAMLGVPTLSCDYAAMRNMDRVTSMNMHFYSNNNVDDAVRAVREMEEKVDFIDMPSREELRKHVVVDNETLCLKIYKVICQFLPC